MQYASFGTHTVDSVCVPCPHNTFFNAEAQSCTMWTNCYIIYEYVSKNGTLVSDRECSNCVGSSASDTPNAAKCSTTVEAMCMKMRGTNCTAQIDFPNIVSLIRSLSLDNLVNVELLPILLLVFYVLVAWSLLGIVFIHLFQRPLKPALDIFEEKRGREQKEKRDRKQKPHIEAPGCCAHVWEAMAYMFPCLSHFDNAKSAKERVKGTRKHLKRAQTSIARKGKEGRKGVQSASVGATSKVRIANPVQPRVSDTAPRHGASKSIPIGKKAEESIQGKGALINRSLLEHKTDFGGGQKILSKKRSKRKHRLVMRDEGASVGSAKVNPLTSSAGGKTPSKKKSKAKAAGNSKDTPIASAKANALTAASLTSSAGVKTPSKKKSKVRTIVKIKEAPIRPAKVHALVSASPTSSAGVKTPSKKNPKAKSIENTPTGRTKEKALAKGFSSSGGKTPSKKKSKTKPSAAGAGVKTPSKKKSKSKKRGKGKT